MALNKPRSNAPWGEYVPNMGPLTVEEFAQLPDEEGWTFELYQGRLIRMPGPGSEHGIVQSELISLLHVYLKAHHLGAVVGTACYVLKLPNGTENILCPDISYSLPIRLAAAPVRGTSYLELTPDLVAEIASPGDTHPEVNTKTAIYLDAGVRLVWNVWMSTKTVEVWRPAQKKQPIAILQETDSLDGFDVIPGFTCLVSQLFA
jgi:Uma2 family endonuclease